MLNLTTVIMSNSYSVLSQALMMSPLRKALKRKTTSFCKFNPFQSGLNYV